LSGHANVENAELLPDCRIRWLEYGNDFPPDRALVLTPVLTEEGAKLPVVCCICGDGIHTFVKERAAAIATLLKSRVGVVIADLAGTGLDRPGEGRGRSSYSAALTSTGLMTGNNVMRMCWAEAEVIFTFLNNAKNLDWDRVVLWGESCSPPVSSDAEIAVPADVKQPPLAEPIGAVIASTLAVTSNRLKPYKAVVARGGLVSYRSVFDSPFVHVPHDALPIDVFRAADLPDVWAHLAPKPLRLEGLVDGTNRRVTGERLDKELRPVKAAYAKGGLVVKEDYTPDAELAKWIIEQLRK
jgi:hypothetical protein